MIRSGWEKNPDRPRTRTPRIDATLNALKRATVVRFCLAWRSNMVHGVSRTLKVDSYTFPIRDDYLACCTVGGQVDELGEDTIVAIQRDWHRRG